MTGSVCRPEVLDLPALKLKRVGDHHQSESVLVPFHARQHDLSVRWGHGLNPRKLLGQDRMRYGRRQMLAGDRNSILLPLLADPVHRRLHQVERGATKPVALIARRSPENLRRRLVFAGEEEGLELITRVPRLPAFPGPWDPALSLGSRSAVLPASRALQ